MIQIVSGRLGAGKTLYTVTDLIFCALCRGATVVTNVEIYWPVMKQLARDKKRLVLEDAQLITLDPEVHRNWQKVIPFGTREMPVEVFLDEIHLFFNARDWQKTGMDSKELLSFLTQSRKACVNVTFISQEIENIEKQFRVLAEWELHVQSSSHLALGFLGAMPWKFFLVNKRSMRTGAVVDRYYRNYDKQFFAAYNSLSFLDSVMKDLGGKNKQYLGKTTLRKISVWRWCWEFLLRDLRSLKPKLRRKPEAWVHPSTINLE